MKSEKVTMNNGRERNLVLDLFLSLIVHCSLLIVHLTAPRHVLVSPLKSARGMLAAIQWRQSAPVPFR
jgi:hypothetical protein